MAQKDRFRSPHLVAVRSVYLVHPHFGSHTETRDVFTRPACGVRARFNPAETRLFLSDFPMFVPSLSW